MSAQIILPPVCCKQRLPCRYPSAGLTTKHELHRRVSRYTKAELKRSASGKDESLLQKRQSSTVRPDRTHARMFSCSLAMWLDWKVSSVWSILVAQLAPVLCRVGRSLAVAGLAAGIEANTEYQDA